MRLSSFQGKPPRNSERILPGGLHGEAPHVGDEDEGERASRGRRGLDEIPLAQALTSTRQVEKGQTLLVWESQDHQEGFTPWILVDRSGSRLWSIATEPGSMLSSTISQMEWTNNAKVRTYMRLVD